MHRIALTLGDAAGVGTEILLRTFGDIAAHSIPVIYGSPRLIQWAQRDLHARGILQQARPIRAITTARDSTPEAICVVDCGSESLPAPQSSYPWGQAISSFGALQYQSLLRAISDTQDHQTNALVTLPWHKARMRDAGLPATGHTEVLRRATDSPDAIMVLCGDRLRVALETIHIPLRDVPSQISTESIVQTTRIFHRGLSTDWGIESPRIAVCGLNPHAGEDGVIGQEDRTVIAPAIRQLQREGIDAEGPFAADTLFPLVANGQREADGILAMYHDQGLIPLKTWHFGRAANVTVGLPIIRTSVDHGTAYDIAGSGKARTGSLRYAVDLACHMVERRGE